MKIEITDLELVTRLTNSGMSKLAIADCAKISETQLMFILNGVSKLTPKIKNNLLNSEELKELW